MDRTWQNVSNTSLQVIIEHAMTSPPHPDILDQNKANAGENINLVALGINNGWFDAGIQEVSYVTFAHNNSYRQLIDDTQYNTYMKHWTEGCKPAIETCVVKGTNAACQDADDICYRSVEFPIFFLADFDTYDVRASYGNPEPPENYLKYLTSASVMEVGPSLFGT